MVCNYKRYPTDTLSFNIHSIMNSSSTTSMDFVSKYINEKIVDKVLDYAASLLNSNGADLKSVTADDLKISVTDNSSSKMFTISYKGSDIGSIIVSDKSGNDTINKSYEFVVVVNFN